MSVLQNNALNLDIFYKKANIPKIALGDKVKVVIYLELPKEASEGEKKDKERIQAFEGVVISKHLSRKKLIRQLLSVKCFLVGVPRKFFY